MNIFVAKLSSETTKEHLADAFGQYGEVFSAKVIIDHETQESKCFGFVELYFGEANRTRANKFQREAWVGSFSNYKFTKVHSMPLYKQCHYIEYKIELMVGNPQL